MARTKVRQETINKISQMGMARSLKHAQENDDPEFREAIRRYYPNAKYGPKTEAAASAPEKTAEAPKGSLGGGIKRVARSRPIPKGSPVGKAVARRIETKPKEKPGFARTGERRKNLPSGFGEALGKSIMSRHKSLEKKFKRTNPKVKSAIADFFTGKSGNDRMAALQKRAKKTGKTLKAYK